MLCHPFSKLTYKIRLMFKLCSCPTDHFNMLYSSLIFNHMCYMVSCFMIDFEENSVDPDQLASEKLADLELHCFQNRI